jgi:hypothetical protein
MKEKSLWRGVAQRYLRLSFEALKKWRMAELFYPDPPRAPLPEEIVVWLSAAEQELLNNLESYYWAKAHIFTPYLNLIQTPVEHVELNDVLQIMSYIECLADVILEPGRIPAWCFPLPLIEKPRKRRGAVKHKPRKNKHKPRKHKGRKS